MLEKRTYKFNNKSYKINIYTDINNDVWIKLRDIVKYLKISINDIILDIDTINLKCWLTLKKTSKYNNIYTNVFKSNTIFINESGIYQIILKPGVNIDSNFKICLINEILSYSEKKNYVNDEKINNLISKIFNINNILIDSNRRLIYILRNKIDSIYKETGL